MLAANRDQLDSFAVQPKVNLVRLGDPDDKLIAVSLQVDSNLILAVKRKVMPDRQSTARAEGEIFVHALVLHEERGERVGLDVRAQGRISHGEATDLAGRRHVFFRQQRRNREEIAQVIKPPRIVGGKKRFAFDLQCQQIANRVGVFGTVESMGGGRPAGIGVGLGRKVEFRLQVGGEGVVAGLIRSRHANGRHLAAPKLTHYFLPHRGVFADLLDVQPVQRQFRRLELLVVAGHTVAIQKSSGGGVM